MATHSSILAMENPMDRGAWQTTVLGVAKESDMTKQLNNNILIPKVTLPNARGEPYMAYRNGSKFCISHISTNGQDKLPPPHSLITDSNAIQTKYLANFQYTLRKLSPFRKPL